MSFMETFLLPKYRASEEYQEMMRVRKAEKKAAKEQHSKVNGEGDVDMSTTMSMTSTLPAGLNGPGGKRREEDGGGWRRMIEEEEEEEEEEEREEHQLANGHMPIALLCPTTTTTTTILATSRGIHVHNVLGPPTE